jgi:hypothetical protein
VGALLALSLLLPRTTWAQTRAERPVGFWASLAVGPSVPNDLGVAAGAAVRYRWLVARLHLSGSATYLNDSVDDWGILVGPAIRLGPSRSQLALTAGIGRSTRTEGCILCGSVTHPAQTAFILNAELRLALTSFFGFTSSIFADFNRDQSFGGLGVGVFFGRL